MINLKPYWNERYGKWALWLGVTVAWLGILLESYGKGRMNWTVMVQETGQITWYLLMFTIFVSLLHKLFPKIWQINNIVPLRKYTGILAWVIGLTHAGSEMLKRGVLGNWNAMAETALLMENGMVFGTASFLIMLPLLLTSTDFAVKTMGYTWWKRLHRLTHLAFVLSAVHIILVSQYTYGYPNLKTSAALTFYVVGYAIVFWRKLKPKPAPPPTPPA